MASNALGKVLLAALGVLAYKNRDRLGELFRPTQSDPNTPQPNGSIFDQLAKGGGLSEILDKFRNAGKGEAVDSWVGTGANQPIDPAQVEAAIDAETLDALVKQTGMSRQEILERLAVNLPETVNDLSPDGRMPASNQTDDEPTLLDPAPPLAPKMSGGSVPNVGMAKSAVADRNTGAPRQDGASPRPTDDPTV